ncbi:MAG: type II toxin-antitoxin system RelE family toxin [Micavibrio sp.]
MKTIEYKKDAAKYLLKMDRETGLKIKDGIKAIAGGNNEGLDVKALTGTEGYRLRVGKFRALFKMDDTTLTVTDVGPRGDIYKK